MLNNNINIEEILEVQSSSNGEYMMIERISSILNKEKIFHVIDELGNVVAIKNLNKPWVCCHTDTAHKFVKGYKIVHSNGAIKAYCNSGPAGIGGDDKCGIITCLHILLEKEVNAAFFVGEEIGGIGASNVDLSFFENAPYIIEFDKKGNNEIVFNIMHKPVANEQFIKDVSGLLTDRYRISNGLFTDIWMLNNRGIKCSCMNMSCGYYKPHSIDEYIMIKDLIKTIECGKFLIDHLHGQYWLEEKK